MNNETRSTHIYVLKDPRDGEIRYVGKTVASLKRRLIEHLSDKKCNHRTNWIKSLVRQGLQPVMELIETVPPGEDWQTRERYWIAYYRELGCDLTNATDGGEGVIGIVRSEETRRKIGDTLRGRKQTPEAIENARLTRIGKPLSEAHKTKISNAHRGKKKSDAHKQKMSEQQRGRKLSSAHKKAIGLAHRGKKVSEETKNKKRQNNTQKRSIQQLDMNGVPIRRFNSLMDAQRETGIHATNITKCAKGFLNQTGGFRWEYVEE